MAAPHQKPKLPALKPGVLDRLIERVAPQWALSRHRARITMAASGGYVGAGYSERMAYWQPGVADADGDSTRDLQELRARSRDLVRNSPIAGGAIETHVTYVVGAGLTLQSRIDAEVLGMDPDQAAAWQSRTERRFRLWAESTLCDVCDEQTFAELQDLAYRTRLESGDAAVVLARQERPNWPYTLALQIIEADRIANPQFAADRPGQVQGVERDANGAVVALHLCSHHPGTMLPGAAPTWQRIPMRGASGRRNVLLLKRKLRPGQTRGIPELAPIIGTLKQMTRYSDAEIDAAVNSAAQAVFVKMDPDSFQELFDDDAQAAITNTASRWDGSLRSGSAINLLPGESIESPNLGRPNPNFDPFMSAFMRFVGIGLNIPHEVLSKHFQASYSAARAALMDAWRTFKVRRDWLASKLCQPTYEEWLADDVAAGNTQAPGFFASAELRAAWCGSRWSGDGPGALDPFKEANAMGKRIELGVTTLADEIVAYDGGDWEQKHRQRSIEHHERVEAGLEAPVVIPVAPADQIGAQAGQQQDGADQLQPENPNDETGVENPAGAVPSEPSLAAVVMAQAAAVMALAVRDAAPLPINVAVTMPEIRPPEVVNNQGAITFNATFETPGGGSSTKTFQATRQADGSLLGEVSEVMSKSTTKTLIAKRQPDGSLAGIINEETGHV